MIYLKLLVLLSSTVDMKFFSSIELQACKIGNTVIGKSNDMTEKLAFTNIYDTYS